MTKNKEMGSERNGIWRAPRKDGEKMSDMDVVLAITKGYLEDDCYSTQIEENYDEIRVTITKKENEQETVLSFLGDATALFLFIKDNKTFMLQNPNGMSVPRGKNAQGQIKRIIASIIEK